MTDSRPPWWYSNWITIAYDTKFENDCICFHLFLPCYILNSTLHTVKNIEEYSGLVPFSSKCDQCDSSEAARNYYATCTNMGEMIKTALCSVLYNSIKFVNQHTGTHGCPTSREVTRNGPWAAFRLISDNPYAQTHIDNCLKIISLVTVVKCFESHWRLEKCTQLFWPQIEKQLSFQWERYAHRGKDKEVSRSGVSAPSGTNTRPFKRPHRETRGNWFQLYSWSNAWLCWRVTQ